MSDTGDKPSAPPESAVPADAIETAPAEHAPPPAADFVTRADFESGMRMLGESIVEGLRPQPVAAALPRDVTDAEIDAAAAEGRPIAPLLNQRSAAREAALRAEYDQRIANLEAEGRGAIGTIANTVMPSALPYYEPYKKEIRAQLAEWDKINPGASSNPNVIKNAHDLVAGRHAGDIEARARRESLREAREVPPAPVPGTSGRTAAADAARPLHELVPEDSRRLVQNSAEMAAQLQASNHGRAKVGLKPRTMEEFEAVLRREFQPEGTVH